MDVVAEATSPSEPALQRAARLALATHLIRPFPRANWQVAILLYMLVAGRDLPRLVDWGIAEQLALHRATNYGDLRGALGAGSGDGDRLDPLPFQRMLTELSTAGAELWRRRLEAAGSILDELQRRVDNKRESAIMILAVFLRRFARPGEIADDLGWPDRSATVMLGNLAYQSVLKRRQLPPSRRDGTDRSAYEIDNALRTLIDSHLGPFATARLRS